MNKRTAIFTFRTTIYRALLHAKDDNLYHLLLQKKKLKILMLNRCDFGLKYTLIADYMTNLHSTF
jgi:hypothetical protein